MASRLLQSVLLGAAFGVGFVVVLYFAQQIWPSDTRRFSASELGRMLEVQSLKSSTETGTLRFQVRLANHSEEEIDELFLGVDLFDTDETLVGSCSTIQRGILPEQKKWIEVVCEDYPIEKLPPWTDAKVGVLTGSQYAAP